MKAETHLCGLDDENIGSFEKWLVEVLLLFPVVDSGMSLRGERASKMTAFTFAASPFQ